jgi:hypothetical protein
MAAIGAHQTRAGTHQFHRRQMPHFCPLLADGCSRAVILRTLSEAEGDEGSAVVLFKYPWQPSVRTKPEPAPTNSNDALSHFFPDSPDKSKQSLTEAGP